MASELRLADPDKDVVPVNVALTEPDADSVPEAEELNVPPINNTPFPVSFAETERLADPILSTAPSVMTEPTPPTV